MHNDKHSTSDFSGFWPIFGILLIKMESIKSKMINNVFWKIQNIKFIILDFRRINKH